MNNMQILCMDAAGETGEVIFRTPCSVGSGEATIFIDFKQATDLLAMFGGEPNEITLQIGDGHSGRGLYASYTDMPEEGAIFLGNSDQEAEPDADELCTSCNGSGEQQFMTQGHGPDDYEVTGLCSKCGGAGAAIAAATEGAV